jgi:thiol:disulfide interchange protein DsbD
MIAITVSVFGGAGQAKSRLQAAGLSTSFVLGLATLFTVLGVGAAMTGSLAGGWLSNKWVVGFLALVLLAFAAAMFGAFELALPASINNRLATVGGIGPGGAFALGLVMSLVAAPCTGPIFGGILVFIARTHDVALGALFSFSYALGLGVLFFLVGTFALSLPKGGAWMLGIKWFFGVMLTVVALYFLKNVVPPLAHVAHAGTWFGVLATAITIVGLGLASVHIAAERKRSPIAHLSKPFKLASMPLAIVGGFMLVSWVVMPKAELQWLESEEVALQQASAEHRPIIVDFGAAWCGACNELATHTFADTSVRAEAGRFVAVRVDATDEDNEQVNKIKDKYHVVGLPTVVVLDSEGNEKVRFNEFVPPERFLSAIKAVN